MTISEPLLTPIYKKRKYAYKIFHRDKDGKLRSLFARYIIWKETARVYQSSGRDKADNLIKPKHFHMGRISVFEKWQDAYRFRQGLQNGDEVWTVEMRTDIVVKGFQITANAKYPILLVDEIRLISKCGHIHPQI